MAKCFKEMKIKIKKKITHLRAEYVNTNNKEKEINLMKALARA